MARRAYPGGPEFLPLPDGSVVPATWCAAFPAGGPSLQLGLLLNFPLGDSEELPFSPLAKSGRGDGGGVDSFCLGTPKKLVPQQMGTRPDTFVFRVGTQRKGVPLSGIKGDV